MRGLVLKNEKINNDQEKSLDVDLGLPHAWALMYMHMCMHIITYPVCRSKVETTPHTY